MKTLSTQEAADAAGCSPGNIRDLVKAGKLVAVTVPGKRGKQIKHTRADVKLVVATVTPKAGWHKKGKKKRARASARVSAPDTQMERVRWFTGLPVETQRWLQRMVVGE